MGLWVKFMTEYPDTAYFPIKNSPINIAKNANFPLEIKEKTPLTTKATLYKNINELQAQGYEVGGNNDHVTYNITNPSTHRYPPTYKPWGWDDIDHRKSAGHCNDRARLSGVGEEALIGITYLN